MLLEPNFVDRQFQTTKFNHTLNLPLPLESPSWKDDSVLHIFFSLLKNVPAFKSNCHLEDNDADEPQDDVRLRGGGLDQEGIVVTILWKQKQKRLIVNERLELVIWRTLK